MDNKFTWIGWEKSAPDRILSSGSRDYTDGNVAQTSLSEVCASTTAKFNSFDTILNYGLPVPQLLQERVLYYSFPTSEEDLSLYACLANGNNEEFDQGVSYFENNCVENVLQIGFLLSATVNVTENENTNTYDVSICFDRTRITKAVCSCNRSSGWCCHVIAVSMFRTHKPNLVKLRPPFQNAFTDMSAIKLRKFAQYFVSALPLNLLPIAQKVLEEISLEPETEDMDMVYKPDATCASFEDGMSLWNLNPIRVRHTIKRVFDKWKVVPPMVYGDVHFLTSNHTPAITDEYWGLLRPLVGRQPDIIWNLFDIIEELLRKQDQNALVLAHVFTEELMEYPQLLCWWYAVKVSYCLQSGQFIVKHVSGTNTYNSQKSVALMCDKMVSIWRRIALHPLLSDQDRSILRNILKRYHLKTLTQVSANTGYLLTRHRLGGIDLTNFSGFKPALEACNVVWNLPEITTIQPSKLGYEVRDAFGKYWREDKDYKFAENLEDYLKLEKWPHWSLLNELLRSGYAYEQYTERIIDKLIAKLTPNIKTNGHGSKVTKYLQRQFFNWVRNYKTSESPLMDAFLLEVLDNKSFISYDTGKECNRNGSNIRRLGRKSRRRSGRYNSSGFRMNDSESIDMSVRNWDFSENESFEFFGDPELVDPPYDSMTPTNKSEETSSSDDSEESDRENFSSKKDSILSISGAAETTKTEHADNTTQYLPSTSSGGLTSENFQAGVENKETINDNEQSEELTIDRNIFNTVKLYFPKLEYIVFPDYSDVIPESEDVEEVLKLDGGIFSTISKMENKWECANAQLEGFYAFDYKEDAVKLAIHLAEILIKEPPNFNIKIAVNKHKKKRNTKFILTNQFLHRVSVLASMILDSVNFIIKVLLSEPTPENCDLAVKIGFLCLEMIRPPASTKPLEVNLINKENILLETMKTIPITNASLELVRKMIRNISTIPKIRGQLLLPYTLAHFSFAVLSKSGNVFKGVKITSEDLESCYETCLFVIQMIPDFTEKDYPMLCEGLRKQRSALISSMIVHYKTNPVFVTRILNKIIDPILDPYLHKFIMSDVFVTPSPPVIYIGQKHRLTCVPTIYNSWIRRSFNIAPPNDNYETMLPVVRDYVIHNCSQVERNRILPKRPAHYEATEAIGYDMIDLAKSLIAKADDCATLYSNNVANDEPTEIVLRMSALILGMYGIGIRNCARNSSWRDRNYDASVQWLNGLTVEIGSLALLYVVENWRGHYTPLEILTLGSMACQAPNNIVRKLGGELTFNALLHCRNLSNADISRCISHCRDHSFDLGIKGCHVVENIAKSCPISVDALMDVAKTWKEMRDALCHRDIDSSRQYSSPNVQVSDEILLKVMNAITFSSLLPARKDDHYFSTNLNLLMDQQKPNQHKPVVYPNAPPTGSFSPIVRYPPQVNYVPLTSQAFVPQAFTSYYPSDVQAVYTHNSYAGTVQPAGVIHQHPATVRFLALQPRMPLIQNHPSFSSARMEFNMNNSPVVQQQPVSAVPMNPVFPDSSGLINNQYSVIAALDPSLVPVSRFMAKIQCSMWHEVNERIDRMIRSQDQFYNNHGHLIHLSGRPPSTNLQKQVHHQIYYLLQLIPANFPLTNSIHTQNAPKFKNFTNNECMLPTIMRTSTENEFDSSSFSPIERCAYFSLSAYRVGMICLRHLARKVNDSLANTTKISRVFGYSEDIFWLTRMVKEIGRIDLMLHFLCAIEKYVDNPFVLSIVMEEAAPLLLHQLTPEGVHLFYPELRSLVVKTVDLYVGILNDRTRNGNHQIAESHEDYNLLCQYAAKEAIKTKETAQRVYYWTVNTMMSCRTDYMLAGLQTIVSEILQNYRM